MLMVDNQTYRRKKWQGTEDEDEVRLTKTHLKGMCQETPKESRLQQKKDEQHL